MSTPETENALSVLQTVDSSIVSTVETHMQEIQAWLRDWRTMRDDIKHALETNVFDSDAELLAEQCEDAQRAFGNAADDLSPFGDDFGTFADALSAMPAPEDDEEDED